VADLGEDGGDAPPPRHIGIFCRWCRLWVANVGFPWFPTSRDGVPLSSHSVVRIQTDGVDNSAFQVSAESQPGSVPSYGFRWLCPHYAREMVTGQRRQRRRVGHRWWCVQRRLQTACSDGQHGAYHAEAGRQADNTQQRRRQHCIRVAYYKRAIWYSFLECTLQSLRDKFSSHHLTLLKLVALVPSVIVVRLEWHRGQLSSVICISLSCHRQDFRSFLRAMMDSATNMSSGNPFVYEWHQQTGRQRHYRRSTSCRLVSSTSSRLGIVIPGSRIPGFTKPKSRDFGIEKNVFFSWNQHRPIFHDICYKLEKNSLSHSDSDTPQYSCNHAASCNCFLPFLAN